MRVFITGVGGFIGGELARYLHSKGVVVRGASHDVAKVGAVVEMLERAFEFDLESEINPVWFEGCDAVVHCAYDGRPGKGKINVQGTLRIYQAAERAGVPFQLFISSHSARPDAVSEYGLQKYEIERMFLEKGQAVIRPGLVVGNGGLYARNRHAIMRIPFLVLPGGKSVPIYYVAVTDLLYCIMMMVERRMFGAYNIFGARPVTLLDYVREILKSEGRRAVVFSVPLEPLFFVANCLEHRLDLFSRLLSRIETARLNMFSPIHQSDINLFKKYPLLLRDAVKSDCDVVWRNDRE